MSFPQGRYFGSQEDRTMSATRIYQLLHEACAMLETAEDHAIAAYAGFALALVAAKYGITQDAADPACLDRA